MSLAMSAAWPAAPRPDAGPRALRLGASRRRGAPYTAAMTPLSPIGRRPDFARLAAWERERTRGVPPDHARNLRIAEALLAEARSLGVWPPEDPLGGIDVDIRIARAVNSRV